MRQINTTQRKSRAFFVIILFSVSYLVSCTKQNETQVVQNKSSAIQTDLKQSATGQAADQVTESLKKIATHFRFAASLEREILKTIRPDLNLPMTQFEILSTVLDQRVGIKKNFARVDCKLFKIEPQNTLYLFFKQCQNPQVRVADVETKTKNQISVHFYTSEWASVVGQSVALTAADRVCVLTIEEDKLKRLSCENTNLALDQAMDVQELRLKEFVFDQKAEFQVQVSGGFYKNLVEHRKLNMKIPFDGKIKIIEKELKVRDDFAGLDSPQKTGTEHIEIQNTQKQPTEGSDGQKSNEEKSENNNQEEHQKNNPEEKLIEEGHKEVDQESPQREKSR